MRGTPLYTLQDVPVHWAMCAEGKETVKEATK